jgi:hypothetical protein
MTTPDSARARAPQWLSRLAPLVAASTITVLAAHAHAQAYPPAAPGVRAPGARVAAPVEPEHAFERWQLALGIRTSVVRDAGFDPFSTGDLLAQFSATLLHTLRAGEGLVPALGVSADFGSSSAIARGADAQLDTWRLALHLEPRFVPAPGFYLAARIAPGLQHTSATLTDGSAPAPLSIAYSTLSVDASLGGGVRLNPGTSPIGLWLVADAGYGWAPRRNLTLVPELPARDASKAGATELGSLSARGMFGRMSLAVSY